MSLRGNQHQVVLLASPATAPAGGVKSGDVLVVGNLIGVCNIDAIEDAETELSLTGVWELPKASGQILQGAAVSWDDSAKNVVAPGSGKYPIGAAVKAAGTNDATMRVRLSGIPVVAAGA